MAKSDRLLCLVNLIKSNQNFTSKKLAEKCAVSERTIFRYINSLASASLPIYNDHGYKFMDSAFLPTINLTAEELSTLQFAFEFSPVKLDPGLSTLAKSILAKLEASTKSSRVPDGYIRKGPASVSSPDKEAHASTSDSQEMLKCAVVVRHLNTGITQKKAVKVMYKNQELLIEPFALVQKNPSWIVLCILRDADQAISLDISKITSTSLTDQPSESRLSPDKLLAPCL
jgi:predicted DNA-binding transcriptional regulator YafY